MIALFIFFSCLSMYPSKDLVDNPNQDFDGDGLTEIEGDCDDNEKNIKKIIWYVDSDGDGSLSPDELRGVADSLEQDELASYTCFQLEEVMRQKQEAGSSREEMMEIKQLMRKKGCFGA